MASTASPWRLTTESRRCDISASSPPAVRPRCDRRTYVPTSPRLRSATYDSSPPTTQYGGRVAFSIILPEQLEWTTRPHQPGEPARHVAELQGTMSFEHTRGNVWRYEPGARGRRHVHSEQEETFVVLAGSLTMHLGEPPERHIVPVGGILHVTAGTPLQTLNEGEEDLCH